MAKVKEDKGNNNFFKPRARLLQLLGDQLIRDQRIGVFELVKNAYDADSPSAEVIFKNITDPDKALIEINDKGDGMDYTTVKGVWLEPGADNREQQRKEGKRTPIYNRLPIGEKGVGRFATHKLGQKILMITRKLGHDEVVVDIDWNQLTSAYRYLDDSPVSVITRTPEFFSGNKHGTSITITNLRHKWTRGDIRRLYRSINAISSPYDISNGFSVDFKLAPDPDNWLDDLISANDIEEQAMFFYEFTIHENSFDYMYDFRPLEALKAQKGIQPRTISEENKILEFFQMQLDDEGKRKKRAVKANLKDMGIGEIKGRVFGFDRDWDVLNLYVTDSTGLQEYLNENGGIRVYRDGIRVYNYGEKETDWLGLDERRIQIPARRISNNLILGEVHLDLSCYVPPIRDRF